MLRTALTLLLLMGSFFTFAASTGLYQTEVLLADSDSAERDAKRAAFENVLIKVSGSRDIANNEIIKKALSKNSSYISQLSYGEINEQPSLKLSFNSKQIKHLLTQAKSSYWSTPRNKLLVWIVEEKYRARKVVWEQSSSEITSYIKGSSDKRGLPVIIPVGDFDDVTSISISDLWGGFVEPIASASQRYDTGAVLLVKVINHGPNNNTIRWTLFDEKPQSMVMSKKGPIEGAAKGSAAGATARMINDVSDYLADQHGIQLGGESAESTLISVMNVQSTEDFFQLETQLKALSSVASLQVDSITGDSVVFNIDLLTSVAEFKQDLANVSQLEEVVVEVIDVQPDPVVDDQASYTLNEPVTSAAEPAITTEIIESEVLVAEPDDPQAASLSYRWNG
ncbi:DUF2066 domain-containing protein [Aliivibrio kagoshimensis]|uniref:DUF2066 domain-containing protein n=1 Tax=Aliivibrio kagoshimensis TaxID=2910230 RepID=UPI003D0C705B